MDLSEKPTQRQLVQVDVASIAMSDIPKTFSEFDKLVWKVFYLGRKDKELELEEIGAQEKWSDE